MEIESEVYKWLVIMEVVVPNSRIVINQKSNAYRLDDTTAAQFENAVLVNKLCDKLLIVSNVRVKPNSFPPLRQENSPQARLGNWNSAQSKLSLVEVSLDPDLKSLAVAGDQQVYNHLLKDIYQQFSEKLSA